MNIIQAIKKIFIKPKQKFYPGSDSSELSWEDIKTLENQQLRYDSDSYWYPLFY